jgi:hypothetical protein
MKLEHLLTQYFYTNKELSLQGIGKFMLSQDFVLPLETDKDVVMPDNAISFEYSNKASEDDGLISYIVQNTKKIRPLASADLDSYLTLGKQFLNIGKPFKIEGIGTLEKNQTGDYRFTQGIFSNTKAETVIANNVKEKADVDISFASKAKEKQSPKKALIIVGLLGLLGLVGFGIWYLVNHQQSITPATLPNKQDTIVASNQKDTGTIKKDSITANPNLVVAKDSFTFKLIIRTYPSLIQANAGLKRLTSYGHKLMLTTTDSITYQLKMPFKVPLSDTAKARDSIRVLLGGKPQLEF